MAPTNPSWKPILGGGLLVAAVIVVIYATLRPAPREPEAVEERATADIDLPDETALPEAVDRVDALFGLAQKQSRSWREDARLTRLYATNVKADGTFDKATSSIQMVFVSQEATRGGTETNGWRFSVRGGKYSTVAIWQHPAPEFEAREVRWCPLDEIVGSEAPEQFTLDIHFAKRGAQDPALMAFTTTPTRWLTVADPFSCKVYDRSRPRTIQEEEEAALEKGASGRQFDVRSATERLSSVIASSSCGKSGPRGPATVQVLFSKEGRAERVSFLAGSVEGTEAGRCLETELLAVRVKPWDRGDGRAAARFVW